MFVVVVVIIVVVAVGVDVVVVVIIVTVVVVACVLVVVVVSSVCRLYRVRGVFWVPHGISTCVRVVSNLSESSAPEHDIEIFTCRDAEL